MKKRRKKHKSGILTLIAALVLTVLLFCHYNADKKEFNEYNISPNEWYLVLVNKDNPIPEDWESDLTELSNGVRVDSRIYAPLEMMFEQMSKQGIYAKAGEGYRTHNEQQKMMNDKINAFLAEGYSAKKADELARDWVAVPGYSEHELGIAVDINADGSSEPDEVYSWLADNAYKYGFIRRYPPGKERITGISNEPWHYRYVGTEAAEYIYEHDLTLEEYLDR